ncbi:methyltransferase domain-containing protein, partial [Bacteriovorax sp. DB6_IX]|uniref:methyltransferase domain-containing protein n=2 Tax=Bacteriovorax sp. DB6_IX TaxID=1353530 RepID=UPI00038A32DF
SSSQKWESILSKSLEEKTKFLNKICHINKRDALVLEERLFDGLSFSLVKEIFVLVEEVISANGFDPSFKPLIFDRLLQIIDIEELYPEEYDDSDSNIIHGEGYHVYSASYEDLKRLTTFISDHPEIHSLCDLGSGSGRALFYMALMSSPKIKFHGLELVKERVDFTNNIVNHFAIPNLSFQTSNFLDTPEDLEGYDAYYLFDPVGTDDVPRLIASFEKMIKEGKKFYMLFISGWDDLMLNALDSLDGLEKLDSFDSQKQDDRFVNFYKVTQ